MRNFKDVEEAKEIAIRRSSIHGAIILIGSSSYKAGQLKFVSGGDCSE